MDKICQKRSGNTAFTIYSMNKNAGYLVCIGKGYSVEKSTPGGASMSSFKVRKLVSTFCNTVSATDQLCVSIHTLYRGRLYHAHESETLMSLTWPCSAQPHTFTKNFIDSP